MGTVTKAELALREHITNTYQIQYVIATIRCVNLGKQMYKLKIDFWDCSGSVSIKSDEYSRIALIQSFIEFMEYRDWDVEKDIEDDEFEEEIAPFAIDSKEEL